MVLITSINAWGQTYKPARVDERKAMPVVTMQGAGMQSQQMMSGGAYSGTVYEPFSNTTPSEVSNPAKAPGGPRKDQASGRNPGEVDPDAGSDLSPIGEPWVMAFFALIFAGVIAIRQYKKKKKTIENSSSSTMKNHLSLKILALFVVLITSISQVQAGSFESCRIYFDNSPWHWGTVKVHCWNGSSHGYFQGYQIAGSDYWYIDLTSWGWQNNGWQFWDNGSNYSNNRNDEPRSSWWTLCFSGDNNQNWTLVGPKNVAISNTTTTYGGKGTEGDPYIVESGVAITCSASANKIDDNTTIEYSFDGGSNYSSTTSHTVESNPTHNGEYSISATIRTYRGEYHSRAFATTTIYYKAQNIHTGLSASATPAAAANAGYPTISATHVNAGSTVDVAAGSPKTGYSWDRWSSSNGSFGTATSASTTFQPSADNAVAVANFTENKSSITINAATLTPGTGGSVTTGSGTNIPLGIATSRAVVASDAIYSLRNQSAHSFSASRTHLCPSFLEVDEVAIR